MKEIITDVVALHNVAEVMDVFEEKTKITEVITELKNYLEANQEVNAIAAPQLGINAKAFCINFNGTIKAFVDPVITAKRNAKAIIEKLAGFNNKEYLVIRPTEITAVYYTDEFKYEDNKFKDAAAVLFDQQVQLLEGTLPADIGLESDINEDGALEDLSEEEFKEAVEMLRKITEIRLKQHEDAINEDETLKKQYRDLRFSESVIDGRTTVVEDAPKMNRETRRAMAKAARRKK